MVGMTHDEISDDAARRLLADLAQAHSASPDPARLDALAEVAMSIKENALRCELCGEFDLDPIYFPDGQGLLTVRSGLLACRGCRTVLFPRPARPNDSPGDGREAPGLSRGWVSSD